MTDTPAVMTAAEAAEYLRLNIKTVYELCAQDAIRHQHAGRKILITRAAADDWLGGHKHPRMSAAARPPWAQRKRA